MASARTIEEKPPITRETFKLFLHLLRARAAVAAVAVTRLSLSTARVTKALGVNAVAIVQAIDRGLAELRTRGLHPDRVTNGILRQVK
jgi:hypothetical protein